MAYMQGGWTDVDNAVPRERGEFLVSTFWKIQTAFFFDNCWWEDEDGDIQYHHIHFWQDLPDSPNVQRRVTNEKEIEED